ncbi:MAG: hypothetical protein V7603_4614 [Micromonosporaceae bacterium]
MTGLLVLTVRTVLALILLVSLATKARDRAGFLDWVRTLAVVPQRSVPAVGTALAAAEGAALVLLVLPPTQAAGLVLAGCVLAFFAGAVGWIVRRGVSVACRCFGESSKPMGTTEVIRNALLSLAAWSAALAALLGAAPLPPAADAAPALLLGTGLALVVVRLDDIVQLFSPLPR